MTDEETERLRRALQWIASADVEGLSARVLQAKAKQVLGGDG